MKRIEKALYTAAMLLGLTATMLLSNSDATAAQAAYCDPTVMTTCTCTDTGPNTVCASLQAVTYIPCTSNFSTPCKIVLSKLCPAIKTGTLGMGTCAAGFVNTNMNCTGGTVGTC